MKASFAIMFVAAFFSIIYPQDTIYIPADYTTIQSGINAANNGDVILVEENIYYENINFKGKAITVASRFLIDEDTSHISNTIIDGSQASNPDSGSVVYFISGEDTTSMICGFTITGGSGSYEQGGGIYCENAGAKITHNIIALNETTGFTAKGGGIYSGADLLQYRILIENNLISSNDVHTAGRFAFGDGGGIYISKMYGKIYNNVISENHCPGSIIASQGGGIYVNECSPVIINNTIVYNETNPGPQSPLSTAGIKVNGGQPIIVNNILCGNTGTEEISENTNVYYCDVEGGYNGIGNIDVYPEFVDSANGDYRLANNSPCIEAGIDSIEIARVWYYCPSFDLEGNPRPNPSGTMPDMGAYENGPTVGVEEDILSMSPGSFSLSQNFPNPFNPSTKISYSIQRTSDVVIKIYNILGNKIETLVNEVKPVGAYEITWYAEQLPSGVYFYQLKAGDFFETKKMILLK